MMAETQETKPVAVAAPVDLDPVPSAVASESDIHLLSRVYSLPLVQTTVGSIYETSKYYTPVLTSTVESSAQQLGSAVKPYEYVYIKPLKTVDNLGCKGLDSLERNFPVITEPTEKVYEYGREYVDTQIIKPVMQVQTSVSETVTPYIDSALTKSDQLIDVILPADETVEPAGDAKPTENGVVKATAPVDSLSGKVYNISTKVSGRIHSRYTKSFEFIGTKTDEQIKQMKFTVDLIQYANENLDKQAKLIGEKLEALKTYVQNSKLAQSVERNISVNLQDYRTSLQSGVDTIVEQIKSNTPTLPAELQKSISQIQEGIDVQLAKIKLTNNQQELSGIFKIASDSFLKLNDIKDYLLQSIHHYTHATNNTEESNKPITQEPLEKAEEEIKKEQEKAIEAELEKELDNTQETNEPKEKETSTEAAAKPEEPAQPVAEQPKTPKKEKSQKKKNTFSLFSSPKKEKANN